MNYPCRILRTGFENAYFNMGLDEAVLDSVASGASLPTLRFYGWKPRAISLGYFQGIRDEIDIEACHGHGVDIVRRITGGGAVFHDAELTYSIVIPEGHPLAPLSILDSYGLLCAGIIEGLKELGIKSEFSPINDIVSGGKKISGNAQTRKKGCLLQHGTVLIKVDVDEMFALLKVPKEKALGKMIADVKERVTSLSDILRSEIAFEDVAAAMEKGFARALDLDGLEDSPTQAETAKAKELAETKFSTKEWIFKR
ncbi:MAG: lipoate--protein ligase family protein [Spirochaetales bacterium]